MKPGPLLTTLGLAAVLTSACTTTGATAPGAAHSPAATPTPDATAAPVSATPGPPLHGILVPPPGPLSMPAEVSVTPPSGDIVWVMVLSGAPYLYRSTDRGATWKQRPIPPGNFPRPEISFIDDHEGWFATGGVPETQCNGAGTAVWHTADGGDTWQQIASADWQHQAPGSIGYRQCKEGLSFVDATHGFLGAADPNSRPTIYATADGGLSWSQSTLPDPPGFTTVGAGVTLTPGRVKGFGKTMLLPAWDGQMQTEYIFRSVDGGATWSHLATSAGGYDDVAFVTESHWLKIYNDRSGLETTDVGKTWHAFATDYQNAAPITALFTFGSPLVGYGTVRGGISRTVDGGLHWAALRTPGT